MADTASTTQVSLTTIKAKQSVQVNYYLNSPDAETIEAERRYIQDKAQRNMIEYHRKARASLMMGR